MLPRQIVLVSLERHRECLMLKALRKRKPAHTAGVGVEIGENLVHTAVLCVQHFLHLRFIERRQHTLSPLGKCGFHFQRLRIAGMTIRIAQTRIRLVQRVPRRPESVQIETAGLDLASGHSRERFA